MRQLIKYFLWMGCLALVVQPVWAFSLLGPVGNGGDAWQTTTIGYNPLPATDAAYGLVVSNLVGPKNLGEGYRRNTPVMYYAFDPSFSDFFGSNGEFAVQQAFDLMNGVFNGQTNAPVFLYSPNHGVFGDTNGAPPIVLSQADSVDAYGTKLGEFPLNTEAVNYQAQALGLQDVKSFTLAALAEQMGLADAVRYTWGLHSRINIPPVPCPGSMYYTVDQRNFAIGPSSLTQVQYSPYVNDELYNYFIVEFCDRPTVQPPKAAAIPIPADPLVFNPPVSSGHAGVDFLGIGRFYTGLTRDDAAGLRFLYSTNNWDNPSEAYRESPAAGSAQFNYSAPQLLYTSNYNALVATSLTNDPGTLQALFPGLTFNLVTNYFSNVVSETVNFVTNYPIGQPAGQPFIGLQTTYATNIQEFYQYAFGNVVTNRSYTNTTFALQTITVGSPIGSPVGSPFTTNVTYQTFQSNVVSGDYFMLTNGECPPDIITTIQTNLNVVTNTLSAVTNTDGSSVVENLVSYFTNYVFVVHACALTTTNAPADYQGIGRIQFIRVRDDNYDYQSGTFITPITNQYTMVVITNGQYQTRTFQRVVTTPDFLIAAADAATGPAALPGEANGIGGFEVFNTANVVPLLAGPGTIDPPTAFTFSKTGTLYENQGPSFLNGPFSFDAFFLWGSFDGTTNAPVVYPNGTSLANLANEMLFQILPRPPNLPNGTEGVSYSVQMTVETGGTPPYTWSLAPNSAGLPPGLYWDGNPAATSSADGIISGTPTQSGTFDGIQVLMTDSSTPPRTVQLNYSMTINNP